MPRISQAAIEHHYATIQLTQSQRDRVRTTVHDHVQALAHVADKETARARAEVTRLDNEERKLLNAHYQDQISDHIFREEQDRIRRERQAAEQLLGRYEINHDTTLAVLDKALELTDNIQATYLQADSTERRLLNPSSNASKSTPKKSPTTSSTTPSNRSPNSPTSPTASRQPPPRRPQRQKPPPPP